MRRVPLSSLVLAVLLGWALMWPSLEAQPRPGAFTSITTTDTTANSALIGCAVGSTSCTGGIKAGPIAATTIAGTTGTFTGQTLISTTANTPGAPAIAFVGDTDTGFYLQAPDTIFLSLGGVDRWVWTLDQIRANATGTAAVPSYAWQVDTSANTGMYRIAEDQIGFATGGVLRMSLSNTTLTHTGAFVLSGVISPAALASGNTNNYNPSGLSTTYRVRLTGDDGGSILTGLAGGVDGREIVLCLVNTPASTTTISHENANSTAANRFDLGGISNIAFKKAGNAGSCATFLYDGTSSRWFLTSFPFFVA